MRRFNLFAAEVEHDVEYSGSSPPNPDGYGGGRVRIGPLLEAAMLGASLYELPPQQGIAPYHYEYGNEEWLIVLAGSPTLRHSGGEEALAPGDVVCFPVGPEGAHKVSNETGEIVRVLVLSTQHEPAVAVYPDSGKVGVWPGNSSDNILVRRESVVDYWDREL